MANPDRPSGFHFVRDLHGASEPTIVWHRVDAAHDADDPIGRGQACKMNTDAEIIALAGTFASDADGDGMGIWISVQKAVYDSSDTTKLFPFIPARDSIFEVQADDDAPWTTQATLEDYIGGTYWFGITNAGNAGDGSDNDSLGNSISELAGNGPDQTGDNYLRIVGWPRGRPDNNTFGAYQKVHVRFNPRLFEESIDFTQMRQGA